MSQPDQHVTILVVDDDPGIGRLIERELRREGYQPAVAVSGADATAWLLKNRAALLLLDLKLPDVNAADFIQSMADAGHTTPFIIITGQGDERVAVDMMKRGALDYLIKDANFIQFIPTVVDRALAQIERGRKLQQQAELLQLSYDAIIVWQLKEGIEFWNPSASKLYGYSLEAARGRDMRELLPTRYPCPWEDVESALRDEGYWEGEVRQMTSKRVEVIVSSRLQVMSGADRDLTILVTNRDISDRRQLEEALLRAIEEEQHRIGRDLHDGVGQELTAIAMLNSVVYKTLEAKGHIEAEMMARLGELLKRASSEVRRISHGLQPVAAEPGALMSGLQLLVAEIISLHGVNAAFDCATPVEVSDPGAANHLFRIAQEATQNALRHGQPRNVIVRLSRDGRQVCMEIEDDGTGMPKKGDINPLGIGLRTMKFRADAMGGFLQVLHPALGGTLIRCQVPLAQEMRQQAKRKRSRASS